MGIANHHMPTSAVGSTNEAVIEMTRRTPDDATVSDIMEEMHFRQTVDAGFRQLDIG